MEGREEWVLGGIFFLAGVLWCWGADPESRLLLVLLGDWSVGALPSSVQQGPGKRPSTRSPRAVAPLAGEKERHLKKNACLLKPASSSPP